MNAGRRRLPSWGLIETYAHPKRGMVRAMTFVLCSAAWPTACGEGISLEPLGPDLPNDGRDAADAEEGGAPDVSFDAEGARDAADDNDASVKADVSEDSSADATEIRSVDALPDRDAIFDGHEEAATDSNGAIADALHEATDDALDAIDGPIDAADGPIDAPVDAGDGCALACGWPDADYYVDAHTLSDGDGSRLSPFKTITRAVAAHRAAPGQPKTAYVAAGTYDRALGEQFPLVLRGLSLKGAGREATFIVGTGKLDHSMEGGAFHDQYFVTFLAGDRELATTISDLSVKPEVPVPTLNYYGVFCDRGGATGEVAPPAGQTRIERASIGPGYQASVLATTSGPQMTGCHVVIRASVLTGGWSGLRAYGCDPVNLSGPVVVEMGGPDPASRNVISWMQAPSDSAAGALIERCVVQSYFENNAFVDSTYGIHFSDRIVGTISPRPVKIKHNSFERLTAGGIIVSNALLQVDELSDNRFVGISRVNTQDPAPRAVAVAMGLLRLGKVRRNQFVGNDFGVLLGVPKGAGQPADFGTIGDPGNNVFRCNSALRGTGADLALAGDADAAGNWAGAVHLAGNAWDHLPPTVLTADSIANGCDVSAVRVPNVTLDLQNASLAAPACPEARVPGQ